MKSRKLAVVRPRKLVLAGEDPRNHVIMLAHFGLAYKVISKRTGFSISEVGQILHQEGVRVRDYRDAKNKVSKVIITRINDAPLELSAQALLDWKG